MDYSTRQKFTPKEGLIYHNAGGGDYRCICEWDRCEAVMENIRSGWTFMAHGIGMYDNGMIDWDYSTSGSFRGGTDYDD